MSKKKRNDVKCEFDFEPLPNMLEYNYEPRDFFQCEI